MAIQNEHWISLEEYHEIERNSDIKYEYSNGRVYAMAGGSPEHSRIALNLGGALNVHLRGRICRVFNSDMKVMPLENENPTYYPDITVTCNPEDYKRGSSGIRSPRLIIEVLSPSTLLKDRGEKFWAYQACKSCEEYVMISSDHQEIEVYHRENTNEWRFVRYTAGQTVTFASVGLAIPVSEIYADTDVPPLTSLFFADQTKEIE
jgi:Uma2 family endonuclease